MTGQPYLLSSNQNDASIDNSGICSTLVASMGLGGGYVPMVTQKVDTQKIPKDKVVIWERAYGGKYHLDNISPTVLAGAGTGGE